MPESSIRNKNIKLLNSSSTIINPATEDKQDTIITTLAIIAAGVNELGGYAISEIDDAGDPSYYGYVDKDANWYIMQENVAAKTYRYAKGTTGYPANWTGRAALVYDYFYNTF